jgi:hypothetical protein
MPEHTIAENLQRLVNAKENIGKAITAKGGIVNSNDGLEEYPNDISTIKNELTSININENGTYYSGDETVLTSSTFPVVISDSTSTPIRHIDINGNTVQSGTPTPSSLIIPQGTGEKTGNLAPPLADWISGYINQSGSITKAGEKNREKTSDYIQITAGEMYTFSRTQSFPQGSDGAWRAIGWYDINKGFISRTAYVSEVALSATAPSNAVFCRLSFRTYGETINTMFNVGNTALLYEPYGYKMLISSNSTTIPIYLGEVQTTRRIKKYEFTGRENIENSSESSTESGTYAYVYRYSELNITDILNYNNHMKLIPYPVFISSHFKLKTDGRELWQNIKNGEMGANSVSGGNNIFLILATTHTTSANFKAYLAQQYANGTPVTIYYILATPTTGITNEPLMKIGDYADSLSVDVELPLSQNAKNNIDVNTTLKPSSASFTYNKLSEYIGYNEINVDVPNTYTVADEGKVVNNATLVAQTAMPAEITANDTYDTTLYNSIVVNVPSGGSTGTKNDVTFYDYDGTIVTSYSKDEFANLSALPANPSHEGLTAQGWNWSLADAITYVTTYGSLDIGQMYTTDDGSTRLHIRLGDGRLKPYLGLTGNSNGTTVSINWGDESTAESVTLNTSTVYTPHEYSTGGDYTISINVTSGNIILNGSSSYYSNILRKSSSPNVNKDRVYQNSLISIEIGNNVSIGNYAFQNCYALTSITLPDGVTSIGGSAFQYCYALTTITIPDTVTSIGSYAFNGCYALTTITIPDTVTSISDSAFRACYALQSTTIPDTVTSISDYAFSGCYSLTSITIPDGVTSIGTNVFNGCYALTTITIPDTVTSIGNNVFNGCYALTTITIPDTVTSIGNYAFQNCYSLTSITIPDGVTSIGTNVFNGCYALSSITIGSEVTTIGSNVFYDCYGLGLIKFTSTTPPTVSNSAAWTGVPTDCIIYVPTGTIETYKAATNYPNPSTYTYIEY